MSKVKTFVKASRARSSSESSDLSEVKKSSPKKKMKSHDSDRTTKTPQKELYSGKKHKTTPLKTSTPNISNIIAAANLSTKKDLLQKMLVDSNKTATELMRQKSTPKTNQTPKSILKTPKKDIDSDDSVKKILPSSQAAYLAMKSLNKSSSSSDSFSKAITSTQIPNSRDVSDDSDSEHNSVILKKNELTIKDKLNKSSKNVSFQMRSPNGKLNKSVSSSSSDVSDENTQDIIQKLRKGREGNSSESSSSDSQLKASRNADLSSVKKIERVSTSESSDEDTSIGKINKPKRNTSGSDSSNDKNVSCMSKKSGSTLHITHMNLSKAQIKMPDSSSESSDSSSSKKKSDSSLKINSLNVSKASVIMPRKTKKIDENDSSTDSDGNKNKSKFEVSKRKSPLKAGNKMRLSVNSSFEKGKKFVMKKTSSSDSETEKKKDSSRSSSSTSDSDSDGRNKKSEQNDSQRQKAKQSESSESDSDRNVTKSSDSDSDRKQKLTPKSGTDMKKITLRNDSFDDFIDKKPTPKKASIITKPSPQIKKARREQMSTSYDTDSDTNVTSEPERKTDSNLLRAYLRDNPDLVEIEYVMKSKLEDLTVSSGDEVWIAQCPKKLNPKQLDGIKLKTDSGKFKIDDKKFEYNFERNESEICVLVSKSKGLVAKVIKTNGRATLFEASKKLSLSRIGKTEVDEPPASLNLKLRHPLFGTDYEKDIKITNEIQQKLMEAEINRRKLEKRARKKKKVKSISEDSGKNEMIFELLNQTKSSLGERREKKRKHSDAREEVSVAAPRKKKKNIAETASSDVANAEQIMDEKKIKKEKIKLENESSSEEKKKKSKTIENKDIQDLLSKVKEEVLTPKKKRKSSKSKTSQLDKSSEIDSKTLIEELMSPVKKKKKHKKEKHREERGENVDTERRHEMEGLNESGKKQKKKKAHVEEVIVEKSKKKKSKKDKHRIE